MSKIDLNAPTRRTFVLGTGFLGLAACTAGPRVTTAGLVPRHPPVPAFYGPIPDERFPIPAVPPGAVDPRFWRTVVPNTTGERAGVIVVDTPANYLYLTREDGTARRYGIGVGREGFSWSGSARIDRKAKWPTWTPPSEMIEREPHLEEFRNGMDPGLDNPLGARALYLYRGGQDTLYRIHGTNEPYTIGHSVSSGCIRMLNQDVIDLYGRVPRKTMVIVRPHTGFEA